MTADEFKQMDDAIRDAPNPQAWLAAVDALEALPRVPMFKMPCTRCMRWDTTKRTTPMVDGEPGDMDGEPGDMAVVCVDPCPDRLGEFVGVMDYSAARFERWLALQDQRLGR